MQAWAVRRVNIRPLTNIPMLDLKYLRTYRPSSGFTLHIDGSRGLPRDKRPVVGKASIVSLLPGEGKALGKWMVRPSHLSLPLAFLILASF